MKQISQIKMKCIKQAFISIAFTNNYIITETVKISFITLAKLSQIIHNST